MNYHKTWKYLIGQHFPRILTWFARRVMITIRLVQLQSWTSQQNDPPFWYNFNSLKKTSKTGRNVGFKDILTSENPENSLKILIFRVFQFIKL